ncbi:hypothetical protein L3X38_003495 [Prunus dulcis]|uniref:Uncharacterized protein n=1 Tax=Prunus dulcis TaxID=3755 RepID=A0AAD4ZM76_PRUDU|nr:hypothetical protein L3X38_003495 [Prunus dulcis]
MLHPRSDFNQTIVWPSKEPPYGLGSFTNSGSRLYVSDQMMWSGYRCRWNVKRNEMENKLQQLKSRLLKSRSLPNLSCILQRSSAALLGIHPSNPGLFLQQNPVAIFLPSRAPHSPVLPAVPSSQTLGDSSSHDLAESSTSAWPCPGTQSPAASGRSLDSMPSRDFTNSKSGSTLSVPSPTNFSKFRLPYCTTPAQP